MATVQQLKQQAKARKIPKYSRMDKAQLMGALGINPQTATAKPLGDARARATAKQHGIAKTYAADKLSGKLGGDDVAKKEAIKQRIVKSVGKELKAHEKKIGRKLTIEEKRSVAVKALASEVRAIKSGVPEKSKAKGKKKAATPADIAAKNLADLKSQEMLMNFRAHAERTRLARKAGAYVPSAEQESIAAKADAAKTPKHSSVPFKRRKGGALAQIGGRMERSEGQAEPKDKKSAGRKAIKLKPQEAIDHKHAHPSPTEHHIDGWLKDTALRVGKPTASGIQKATIEHLGNVHNLPTKGVKTLDAMTSAIHDKLKKSKGDTTLADAKDIVNKTHKSRTEKAEAEYKAIQSGDKAVIDRVGRTEAFKLPGNHGTDYRNGVQEHLSRTFSKSGGDSKALGLTSGQDFTVGELKAAYRAATLKAHPDRGGSADKFHALKESYERMLPKAKSPALDKVAEQTGMTREEVAKAVKRRKAKA